MLTKTIGGMAVLGLVALGAAVTGANAQHAASTNVTTVNGLAVYDSTGKYIGAITGGNFVSTSIGSSYIQLQVAYSGFFSTDSSNVQFYHAASDCSDARYLDASGLPANGVVSANHLFVPNMASISPSFTTAAIEAFNSGVDPSSTQGQCIPFAGVTLAAAPALTLPLPSFTPPFVVR